MVRSMFAAISGLSSHQTRMDVIGNNIANVNTWGYKSRSANFSDAMYQNIMNSTAGTGLDGQTGGVNSSQLGYGVNVGSITTSFATGSRGYTADGFNCMLDGTGFFIVGPLNSAGIASNNIISGGVSLSRVGIFSIDGNGYLVDDQGNHVYGFLPDDELNPTTYATANLTAIRIPTDDTATPPARYDIQTISIGLDGIVTGVDSLNRKVTIGQIAVASVENPNGLVQGSGYLYNVGNNAGMVEAIPTVATTTGQILSGYLEMSNVDLATEMANMITTQRGYQANTKIITVTDEMLEQLVNMKR